MAGDRAGALAHLDDESILSRIAAGERPSHIATELGVHKSAIYHRFAHSPHYDQAREHGAEVRIEKVENDIETAQDAFTLSRARELGRIVMWRNEREFPHRWGQKQEVHHTFSISDELKAIAERRQAEAQQVVDGEVVHTQQTSRITSGVDEG